MNTNTSTARRIGSTTIHFGLISIPVCIFTTNETAAEIKFNQLHDKDQARLKQQYVCTVCNEVVDKEHIVKGYEHAKDQYIAFSTAELEAIDAVATETLDLVEFVPAGELDSMLMLVESSFYLGPDKGADKAYQLLADGMRGAGSVGIGRYKDHVVCVRPYADGLMYHKLRYDHEVRDWSALPTRVEVTIAPTELRLAKQFIQRSSSSSFDPAKYVDTVYEGRRKLVEAKVAGQEIPTAAIAPPTTGSATDLIEALRASLDTKPPKAAPAPVKARAPRARARTVAKKKRAA